MLRKKIDIATLQLIVKKIFSIVLILLLPVLIGKGLYFARGGWSPRRFQSLEKPLPMIPAPDAATRKILSQPFYYLGRGRQCFAFTSKDGKYVLKCPRTNIYNLPFWARVLPVSEYRKKQLKDKAWRQEFIFGSFRLAKEELQDITGVIATHLGESDPINEKITLVDAFGCSYDFPMEKMLFILQHKYSLWAPVFLGATKNNDITEQKRLLNGFIDTVIYRAKKGILDRDRSFVRNYGINGEKVCEIDIGAFFQLKDRDKTQIFQKAVHETLAAMQEWLAKENPQMVEFVKERLENLQFDDTSTNHEL